MSTIPITVSLSSQQHKDLWILVKNYIKLRKHLMYLAQGGSQHEGVFHWARVREARTDMGLYMRWYHPEICGIDPRCP